MKRRALLASTLNVPLLTGCWRARFFDLGWDEEVLLHDGRLIVVKLKYTYERLGTGLTLDKYDPSILRNTELSFDAGHPIGQFSQLFRRHRVDMIEQFNGKWYFLLETAGAPLVLETNTGWNEEWGSTENSSGHKCWSLDKTGLVHASINDLPDGVLKINVLIDYAPAKELAIFAATRVTLSQKSIYEQKHPLDPPRQKIQRPQSTPVTSK